MGGLSGHMMHPFDNMELTKEELKDMVIQSLCGNIHMCEKVDGFNIHVTYFNGEVRFARNKKDLQNGGFSVNDMIMKWHDKPNVLNVYLEAAKLIIPWVEANKDAMQWQTANTITTLNCECLIAGETNLIDYPDNRVYIHNIWLWNESGVDITDIDYELSQYFAKSKDVYYKQMLSQSPKHYTHALVDFYKREIEKLFGDIETIERLYQTRFVKWIDLNAQWMLEAPKMVPILFDRFFNNDKSIKLNTIKAEYKAVGVPEELVDKLCKEEYKYIVYFVINPLKELIYKIGDTVIGNMTGYINEYNKYSVCEKMYEMMMEAPRDCDWWTWHDTLDGVVNPLEGCVFEYKGNLYKWTGSFAIINKILGKIKYENIA